MKVTYKCSNCGNIRMPTGAYEGKRPDHCMICGASYSFDQCDEHVITICAKNQVRAKQYFSLIFEGIDHEYYYLDEVEKIETEPGLKPIFKFHFRTDIDPEDFWRNMPLLISINGEDSKGNKVDD